MTFFRVVLRSPDGAVQVGPRAREWADAQGGGAARGDQSGAPRPLCSPRARPPRPLCHVECVRRAPSLPTPCQSGPPHGPGSVARSPTQVVASLAADLQATLSEYAMLYPDTDHVPSQSAAPQSAAEGLDEDFSPEPQEEAEGPGAAAAAAARAPAASPSAAAATSIQAALGKAKEAFEQARSLWLLCLSLRGSPCAQLVCQRTSPWGCAYLCHTGTSRRTHILRWVQRVHAVEQEIEQATRAVKEKVTTATGKASHNVKAALQSLAEPTGVQLSKAAQLVGSLLPPVRTSAAAGAPGRGDSPVGSPHAVPSAGIPTAAAMSPLVLVFAPGPRDEEASAGAAEAKAKAAETEADDVASGAGSSADEGEGEIEGGGEAAAEQAGSRPAAEGAVGQASGSGESDDDESTGLDCLVDGDDDAPEPGAEGDAGDAQSSGAERKLCVRARRQAFCVCSKGPAPGCLCWGLLRYCYALRLPLTLLSVPIVQGNDADARSVHHRPHRHCR